MCPVCLGNLALLAACVTSSSGLTAFAVATLLKKKKANRRKQNENEGIEARNRLAS
jgi:hypothetical protein